MWDTFKTNAHDGMLCEVVSITGADYEAINVYLARPMGDGPYPSIVLIPHRPGWDEFYRETARRFAQHGYVTICPDLYCRFGHGTPTEIASYANSQGGVADNTFLGDCKGCIDYVKSQPYTSQKVGVIGTCSGGRHAYLAACQLEQIDAVVDCWGGKIVAQENDLNQQQPVAPLDYTERLNCPILGIFGNDDKSPSPEDVDILESKLKELNKDYDFYRYDGCGHGFWYYHTDRYRPKAAMDSWEKVLTFFDKHLR
ncbi:MAG: dienelactone hydrolase family protein [Erysipelotrichaceae bacterium]|nr:dienelactone hydrolase family protein [Erysipelotrichaceae bacterium]MDD3924306.1 dienelactone hydrolase family protein [Erysipelotrichaceae bacterium]MDD4642754.1 dienelactone hydrolase family protein [Erysipelotrichaceae bacterium]